MRQTSVDAFRGLCFCFALAVQAFAFGVSSSDVAITQIYIYPPTVEAFHDLSCTVRVKNQGSLAVQDQVVTVTVPNEVLLCCPTIATGTISMGKQVVWTIPQLGIDQVVEGSFLMNAPATTGTVEFLATTAGATPDFDMSNNTTTSLLNVVNPSGNLPKVRVAWSPDLKQQPSYRLKSKRGLNTYSVKGTALVTNLGTQPTPDQMVVNFYATRDQALFISTKDNPNGDWSIGAVALKPIPPGRTKKVKLKADGLPFSPSGRRILALGELYTAVPADSRAMSGMLP